MKHTSNKVLILFISIAIAVGIEAAQEAPQKLTIPWKELSAQQKLHEQRKLIRSTYTKESKTMLDNNLERAIARQERFAVRDYLALAANPNGLCVDACKNYGRPFIELAAKKPSTGIVQDLLDAGAIVDGTVINNGSYRLPVFSMHDIDPDYKIVYTYNQATRALLHKAYFEQRKK